MEKCIFCQIPKGEASSWKVYEDDTVYAFFDVYPANKYHTLVVPKKHYQDIFTVPENVLTDVLLAVKKIALLYKEKLGIENVQIINSSGTEAQQEVAHIHFHLVPRKNGDGQDITWKTHPEYKDEFDELLQVLNK